MKGAISACTLRTKATADDLANDGDGMVDGNITMGVVYPYVQWDVDLGTCAEEPIALGDPSAPVAAVYSETNATQDEAFANAFAPTLPPPPAAPLTCGGGTCAEFSHSGADQTFVVPAGVTAVRVKLWGAGGGGGGDAQTGSNAVALGGAGGYTEGVMAVTPGESLTIIVGGRGLYGGALAYGGAGGGGFAGQYVGHGGGRSAVRRGGDELLTAGGGGGGGGHDTGTNHGGPGGGEQGGDATGMCGGGGAAGPPDPEGPGLWGQCAYTGAGSTLAGQFQGGINTYCGAGGGGGWYGGGAGNFQNFAPFACGGGGGGSGHVDASVLEPTLTAGVGAAPPNTGDSDYGAGIGVGGPNQDHGGHGRAVIVY